MISEDEDRISWLAVEKQRLMVLLLFIGLTYLAVVVVLVRVSSLADDLDLLLASANHARPAYRLATLALGALASVCLFVFRRRHRLAYGVTELAAAVLGLTLFASRTAPSTWQEWVAGFLAPIYIAIRGLDNIEHGVQHIRVG